MKLEAVRIKNFRAFKDVEMTDIPSFCVLVGANGVGKSTFFSIFGFLKDAMTTPTTTCLRFYPIMPQRNNIRQALLCGL